MATRSLRSFLPVRGHLQHPDALRSRLLRLDPKPVRKPLPFQAVILLASLCAAAGLLTIWPSVRSLFDIWTTDDLKSMGMVVPLVCYLLSSAPGRA